MQVLHEECPILMWGKFPKVLDLKRPLQGPTKSKTGLVVQKLGYTLEMGPNR